MEANGRALQKEGVPNVKAAEVQKIFPGIKYPLKLAVRVLLVTSGKTAAVLYWGLMPDHRKLKCSWR